MREIKFRVWSKPLQKFTNGYEDQNRINYDELYSDAPGLFFGGLRTLQKDDDYVLQQFTGLKDRKGNEIFDGDIIKYFEPKNKYREQQLEFYNRVRWGIYSDGEYVENLECWMCGGFPLSTAKTGGVQYCRGESVCTEKGIEIVGNIFENPDLLK